MAKFFLTLPGRQTMTRYTKLDGRRSIGTGSALVPSSPTKENDEAGHTVPESAISARESADPKALLKRVKLLRLKAKKAKSEDARLKYLHQAKETEKMANAANGARGIKGKREVARGKHARARLGMYSH